jgi:hypothetical protein
MAVTSRLAFGGQILRLSTTSSNLLGSTLSNIGDPSSL